MIIQDHFKVPNLWETRDTGARTLLRHNAAGSAANFVDLFNAAAGGSPGFLAEGTEDDIDFIVDGKGTGRLKNSAGQNYLIEGEGGVPTAIGDIPDVTISSPQDDQLFGYDSGSGHWVNKNAAEIRAFLNVEDGAAADMSAGEIKTQYESNPDTNAFTDALLGKLNGVEANAKDDQTGSEIKALYEAEPSAFTNDQFTKLAGIEANAKDDQTGAEIKLLYEGEADTNAFTDAHLAKLNSLHGNALNKLDGTAPPTANDDSANTSGNGNFSENSKWIDQTNDEAYVCVDDTPTAAVWVKTTLDTAELAPVALSGDAADLTGTLDPNRIANGTLPLAKLSTDPLARASHTGTQTLATISDSGALAAKNTVATTDLDDDSVTFAKMQHTGANTLWGSIAGGEVEALSATSARTILNVADGANNYTHPGHTGHVTSTGDGATVFTVSGITEQTLLASGLETGDELVISDGGVIKRTSFAVVQTLMQDNLNFNDANAIHIDVADEFLAVSEKVSPTTADILLIEDQAAGGAKKRIQIANLPGSSGLDDWTEDGSGNFLPDVTGTQSIGSPTFKINDLHANGTINFGQNITTTGLMRLLSGGTNTNIELYPNGNGVVCTDSAVQSTEYFALGATHGAPDVYFRREAANVGSLRNGVNGQGLRVYGTDDGTQTDYERGLIEHDGTDFYIRTQVGGTHAGDTPDIVLDPIGNVVVSGADFIVGNYTFDYTQAAGASQDGFSMTYDHSSGKMILTDVSGGGGGGAFTAAGDSTISPTSVVLLDLATGDETAYTFDFTVNKATSGNWTGLKMDVTDSSSPGGAVEKLLDMGVDAVSLLQMRVDTTFKTLKIGDSSSSPGQVEIAGSGSGLDITLDSYGVAYNDSGTHVFELKNDGSGAADFKVGGMQFDGSVTVGAGVDGYAVTYDHSSGKMILTNVSGGGGGLTNWEESGNDLRPTVNVAGYLGDSTKGVAGVVFEDQRLEGSDGSNVLSLRGNTTTNPQEFRIYETDDGTQTDYLRAEFKWEGHDWVTALEDAGAENGNAGDFYFRGGALGVESLASDPTPTNNNSVLMWTSTGAGTGEAGDVIMRSKNGGGTARTLTLYDHSEDRVSNPQEKGSMNFVIADNDGSALTTGERADLRYRMPCDAYLDVKWYMIAGDGESAGNAEFDILKRGSSGGAGTSIIGVTGTPESPNLTAQTSNDGTDFSDWATTTATKGDILTVNLTDNTGGFAWLMVTLEWERRYV